MNTVSPLLSHPVCLFDYQMSAGEAPLVSICCITYNHEPYIRVCLDGFLLQETTFPVEILIHDDASSDNTADIIREYAARYPLLIKPILQTENQFSKGLRPNPTFNFPRAKGEYIALCEGDDFWTDPRKLELQIGYMRQYEDILISAHPVQVTDYAAAGRVRTTRRCEVPTVYSFEDVIEFGSELMPTASIVFKASALPLLWEGFGKAPVGDVVIRFLCASAKGALLIPPVAAHYRKNVPGSWSMRSKTSVETYRHRARMTEFYVWLATALPQHGSLIKKKAATTNRLAIIAFVKNKNYLSALRLFFLSHFSSWRNYG